MILALLSCAYVEPSETEACDPRFLEPGEVRAKEVRCGDEVPSGGEGRVGDVLLQNSELVAVVRPYTSLTLVGHGGGGLIDLAPSGGLDTVLEVLPLVEGGWMQLQAVDWGTDDDEAWVTVEGLTTPLDFLGGTEGAPVELTWRLGVDSPVLEVEGSDELYVHELLGDATATGTWWPDRTLGLHGALVEDLGGARVFGGSTLAAGRAEDVHEGLFPDGVMASGRCDGDRVEVWRGDELVALLGDTFAARVPSDAELVCRAAAAAPGEAVPPGDDLDLVPGDAGGLVVQVEDDLGEDLPALVWVDGEPLVARPDGGVLDLAPGTYEVLVEHGPAHEVWSGTVEAPGELELVLARELSEGWISLSLDRETWPSRESRTDPVEDLERAVAGGHGLVVQLAPGEVAQPDHADWTAHHARVRAGSLTEGPSEVVSWPWSSNSKKPGHGAADAIGLAADDRHVLAQGGEVTDRRTIVGLDWVEEAGAPWQWSSEPWALRLEGPDDFAEVRELLDAGFRPAFVGPVTWSEADTGELPSVAASERGLATASTSAGTGPRLALSASERVAPSARDLELVLEQGSRTRLRQVELWTDRGLLATYEVGDGIGEVLRDERTVGGQWAWAVGWSEVDWAVSPAVWLGGDLDVVVGP